MSSDRKKGKNQNHVARSQYGIPGSNMVWTNEAVSETDFMVFRDSTTNKIVNVVAPNGLQIGLFDENFPGNLTATGHITGSGQIYAHHNVVARLGFTGSLQKLYSGNDYLQAGSNVTVTNNADGSITIAANPSSTTANALTAGSGITMGGSTFDGSAARTIKVDINSESTVTPATGDFVLIHDISDGLIKKATIGTIQGSGATIDIAGLSNSLTESTLALGDLFAVSDIDAANETKKITVQDFSQFLAAESNGGIGENNGKLKLDLNELSSATPDVTADSISIIDANDSNSTKKSTIVGLASGMAGTVTVTGLASSAGTLSVDITNQASVGSLASGDEVLVYDVDTSALKKATVADFSVGAAPTDAEYVVLSANGTLTNEAVLTAGDGLDLTSATLSLDLKSSSGLKIDSTELAIEPADFAGTGLEDDGSDNLRISSAAAGTGLSGGGGSALSVDYGSTSGTAAQGSTTFAFSAGYGLSGGVASTAIGSGISGNFDVEPEIFAGLGLSTSGNKNNVYLKAGTSIAITTGSDDSIVISATSSGGGAVGTITQVTAGTGLSGGGSSGNVTLAIDDSTVATLTGSQFSGHVGVTGSLGSTTFVTSSLVSAFALSGSLTKLENGSDYLLAGTGISLTTGSSGNVTIATSAAAGVLGDAEDSDYTDGLFTDFTTTTPVGTAVDRFNEVLKGLAPSAAPNLDDIDCDDSGSDAVLSFGNSKSITGYTNARPSTLTPSSNLSDVDINATFGSTSASNDLRMGCFGAITTIDGTLNKDVAADGTNFNANSFGDGNQGSLKLFVNNNATPIHTTDLSTFGSGNSLNGNSSGFNLTATTPGHFSDGSNFETFQHRQGTYTITAADQISGWNYARIVHTVGGSDRVTNYVEWVNDPTGAGVAMSTSGASLGSLSMTGTKHLSGVKYHTGGSAAYSVTIANAYRNVYPTGNVTFGGSNTSVSAQSIPAINHGGGEDETKSIVLSSLAVTVTGTSILNGSISVNTNLTHPLKSDLSSAASQSISGILLYNVAEASSSTLDTTENFAGESYRMANATYSAQGDVGGANAWDSTDSLLSIDGLLVYNQTLIAPTQGANGGNFSGITNGPGSNVDYSSLTSGTRTYFRKFVNNSGGSKTNFNLTINGSGTIVANTGTLNTTNIKVFCKMPSNGSASTGFMDLATNFASGQVADNDGCLVGSLDSSLNATNEVTFGTQSVGSNEFIIIKVLADASWTGNISQMSISWI